MRLFQSSVPDTPRLDAEQYAALLADWQQLTQRANQLYRQERNSCAFPLYRQALCLAQQLFKFPLQESTLAALVISRHNLADCLIALNRPEDAANELCLAFQQVQASAALLPMSEQSMLTSHLQRCRLELQLFTQHYPQQYLANSQMNTLLKQALPSAMVH